MFGTASKWAKIGFFLIVMAFIMHLVGLATDYWMVSNMLLNTIDINVGLWNMQSCSKTSCTKASVTDSYKTGLFNGVQGLTCFILLLLFVTMIMYGVYVIVERTRTRNLAIATLLMAYISASFAIITMILWLINITEDYYASYSFGLTILGAALALVAGTLLIPDIRGNKTRRLVVTPRPKTPKPRYPPPRTDGKPKPREHFDSSRNEKSTFRDSYYEKTPRGQSHSYKDFPRRYDDIPMTPQAAPRYDYY